MHLHITFSSLEIAALNFLSLNFRNYTVALSMDQFECGNLITSLLHEKWRVY